MSLAIETSFGRAASRYAEHAVVQKALGEWLAGWLPSERVGRALEVGAGSGLFTQRIGDWPEGLTATDISPGMCAAGRSAMPDVVWRRMAAESPLPGSWTWIFSSGMLQWAQSPQDLLSAWRKCLVPQGRVLAALFVAESLPELRAVSGGCEPLLWRTPETWRMSIESAGLRVLRDAVDRRVFCYPSARDFLRTLHGVGAAPVRRFSAGRMRQLLRDYDAAFREERGVRATWTFYRFEAEVI